MMEYVIHKTLNCEMRRWTMGRKAIMACAALGICLSMSLTC